MASFGALSPRALPGVNHGFVFHLALADRFVDRGHGFWYQKA
jgi:hypothetical protein